MAQLRPETHQALRAALPLCAALLLALLMWLCPVLAWPLAALLPLLVVPCVAKGDWLGALLPLALPCAALVIMGADVAASAALWLPSALGAALWLAACRWHWSFNVRVLGMIGLCAVGNAALLRLATGGGEIFSTLGRLATEVLVAPGRASALLWLARAGVLDVSGYSLLDIATASAELQKALQYQLSEMALLLVPTLVSESAVVVGLLAVMRGEKCAALRSPGEKPAPRFRTLHIPPTYRGYMAVLCLGGLLLPLAEDQFSRIAGDLMYGVFLGVYRLLGVAVIVFVLSGRHPTRSTFYGLLGAAGYLLLPTVTLLVGLSDQILNFRALSLLSQEGKS